MTVTIASFLLQPTLEIKVVSLCFFICLTLVVVGSRPYFNLLLVWLFMVPNFSTLCMSCSNRLFGWSSPGMLMRICHHNALVDIGCHALSQSHPGVLKEQQVSCEDYSHPGDFTIQIFSVAILHILICWFIVLSSLFIFLLLLFVLGLLLQLGSWPRNRNIKMLGRR